MLAGWLARPDVRLIHVTGPAGAGKTALGLALADRLAAAGARVGWARDPGALGTDVWFTDAADAEPLAHAHALLVGLPATQRVVLLSRGPLPAGAIADPALAAGLRSYALPPLSAAAAVELAVRLGADAGEATAVAARTDGWPQLIVAEVERARRAHQGEHHHGGLPIRIRSREVRDALFAAALVRHVTEPVLSAMLETDASRLFDALVTDVPLARTPLGLTLPATLREFALDELALRVPERRVGWARRAQDHLLDHLDRAALDEIPRLAAALVFACRFEPYVAEISEGAAAPPMVPDGSDEARARARAAVVQFEGEASARLFDRWSCSGTAMLAEGRGPGGEPRGFVLLLALHPDGDHPAGDPVVDALLAAVRAGGRALAAHERVHVGRFWLDYEHYQAVRPSVSAWSDLLATGAVIGASVHRDAPAWMAMATRPFVLLAEASVDGTSYAVLGLDRRRESVAAVFGRLVEAARTGVTRPDDAVPPVAPAAAVALTLDRASLAPPLRAALRAFHRAELLAGSPLTGLRWVSELVEAGRSPAAALAQRLEELVSALGEVGHDGQLARTLVATFLAAAPKGYVVAADLGMGYSTYRRWLREALDRVTDLLVARETAARTGPARR